MKISIKKAIPSTFLRHSFDSCSIKRCFYRRRPKERSNKPRTKKQIFNPHLFFPKEHPGFRNCASRVNPIITVNKKMNQTIAWFTFGWNLTEKIMVIPYFMIFLVVIFPLCVIFKIYTPLTNASPEIIAFVWLGWSFNNNLPFAS